MRRFQFIPLALLILWVSACNNPQPTVEKTFYKPWQDLGELFHEVQMAGIYPDSKTFVDCTPRREPGEIVADYLSLRDTEDFDLAAFVQDNFDDPISPKMDSLPESANLESHLGNLWEYLTRQASKGSQISTLIPLPKQYVVPGGRFREVYYWDSYFTMIGLGVSGRTDLIESMVDNFAYLIDTVGFIPNGNRTYYLGRSQPPYFAAMVNLLAGLTENETALKYLPAVQKEYDFWMRGSDQVSAENPAVNRVVRLEDGTLLNRYYDFLDFPRPESYKEDFELAEGLTSDEQKVLYRNLRAGAESGWDYSTRWFENKDDFSSIRTVEILPVDLNSLMYNMERTLADLYEMSGDQNLSEQYATAAEKRKQAVQSIFWDEEQGSFTDYVWTDKVLSDQLTLASTYPLFFGLATQEQADAQAMIVNERFLLPGGLVTSDITSGQQWDAPNGWAPLQWITIEGLASYGQDNLAQDISSRWLRTNQKVFQNTGKMMEKYNVADTTLIAGGGEYPTQDGFGWTNGVALGLIQNRLRMNKNDF